MRHMTQPLPDVSRLLLLLMPDALLCLAYAMDAGAATLIHAADYCCHDIFIVLIILHDDIVCRR